MCDCAIFLCCLNNYNIYCLEYTCLITSILIIPSNLLGIVIIKWNLVTFYCEIIFSINITISIFALFIISLVIYSTKVGKITTNELYKPFISISLMTIFIFIYLFITYSLCSFQIFKDYINIHNINSNYSTNIQKKKLKKALQLKTTWAILCLSTLLPVMLSVINIIIWISIYYRIYFKIYCSFNKEIRKELGEKKKTNKQFKHLEEHNFNCDINKNNDKNRDFLKNFVSIVIEKDKNRHRASQRFLSNGGIYTKNNNIQNNNYSNKKNHNFNPKEYNLTDNISSERNLKKVINKLHS